MTAKEKAEDIYNKMVVDMSIEKEQSKLCSLVAVDQIILEQCKSSELKNPVYQQERIDYWIAVKQELEKI